MLTPRELAEKMLRAFGTHELKSDALAEVEHLFTAAIAKAECPECRVKSLAQYQDKYGIDPEEWTKEQCIEAMRAIHYDRMDLLYEIKQAKAAAFEECAKIAESHLAWKDINRIKEIPMQIRRRAQEGK